MPPLRKYYTIANNSTSTDRNLTGYDRDKLKEHKAVPEAKNSLNDLITKLDEVDMLVRELMKARIKKSGNGHLTESQWLSCLMRCRADIQSAITHLLGGYE